VALLDLLEIAARVDADPAQLVLGGLVDRDVVEPDVTPRRGGRLGRCSDLLVGD